MMRQAIHMRIKMQEQWHYVYYSYEPWGRGYIGKRSCRVSPEADPYMGSFSDKSFRPTEKIVIAIFETAEAALQAEVLLHNFYQVDRNPHFANRSRQTSTGFTCPLDYYQFLTPQQKFSRSQMIRQAHCMGSRGFYFKLMGPSGIIIVTQNLRETCANHGLNRGNLIKVLSGERKHSKGWTICKLPLP